MLALATNRRATAPGSRLHPLIAERVEVDFDGVVALRDVSLRVEPGEILGLIGPNGAGKTTLLNVLSGFQRPRAGRVLSGATDITRWSPQRRAAGGLARTFQSVRLFPRLTAFDNVRVAALATGASGPEARRRGHELLERVGMIDQAQDEARTLPYGAERRLGIARALASRPAQLLLDEPAAGLNEAESGELLDVILGIRTDYGCGVVIIEHDMPLIMRLCDRIQVLNHGETLAVGAPAEVQRDAKVIEAYLGADDA